MEEEKIEKENPAPTSEGQGAGDFFFSARSKIGSKALELKIDAQEVKGFLDSRIKEAVEDVLQVFLEEEATALSGADRYERTEQRKDYRNGYRERKLVTRVGQVLLKVPRLRELAFTTSIIERYQRRECSIDEALLEMYFAGVSTRRVQDITEALWGGQVSADQMSTLNAKAMEQLEQWRNRKIEGTWPYFFCDGMILSRRWETEVHNVSVLIGVGINSEGKREILGVAEGCKEDKESWLNFLRWLKERGLGGIEQITSDKCLGLVAAAREVYPQAVHQRCIVHFYRNVLSKVPRKDMAEVAQALKAIHAQESKEEAMAKAKRLIEKYRSKFPSAMKVVEGVEETLSYYKFPSKHWRYIRTTNMVERLIREIRRRTDVVGSFPDGKSALLLVCARARWITEKSWGKRRYLLFPKKEEALADEPSCLPDKKELVTVE
jgi:transposase-like protein